MRRAGLAALMAVACAALPLPAETAAPEQTVSQVASSPVVTPSLQPVSLQPPALTAADFARDPDYELARISPDGRYLAVIKRVEGWRVLVVLERATLAVSYMEKFNPPNEVADFDWVKDHRLLVSLATQVGSLDAPVLTGQLWGVDADGGRAFMVYDWRGEHPAKTATGPAQLLDPLPRDPRQIVIVIYTGSQLGARIAQAQLLNIYSGELQPLINAPAADARLLTDRNGAVRLSISRNKNFELQLHYRADAKSSWRQLLTQPFGAGDVIPLAFTADGESIYALDNRRTDKSGLCRISLDDSLASNPASNPASNVSTPIFVPVDSDVDTVLLASADRQPYAVRYGALHPRYEFLPAGHGAPPPEVALLRQALTAFPDADIELSSITTDGTVGVVSVRTDRKPATFYLVARDQTVPQELLTTRPWLSAAQLAPMVPVLVPGDGGEPLHGYLTAPTDGRPRPWPMVVLPHGGPHGAHARDRGLFDPLVQLLAQHGYAVLQVNYRGTAGFGQRFLLAGYGEWSGLIQRDIAAATRWALASGNGLPAHICIVGESFGAFSALANAAQWPDLYQCAIGAFGVYDLAALRTHSDTHRTVWGEAYFKTVLGADRDTSLLTQAARIKAPVLIVHGALDQRAPIAQARAMRDALARSHNRVEYLEVRNAGHGFSAAMDLQHYYEAALAFLDRHIGTARPP